MYYSLIFFLHILKLLFKANAILWMFMLVSVKILPRPYHIYHMYTMTHTCSKINQMNNMAFLMLEQNKNQMGNKDYF